MKNNMIIAGVPRAGKSTISHRLAEQYGYQHVSMDLWKEVDREWEPLKLLISYWFGHKLDKRMLGHGGDIYGSLFESGK